MANIRIKDLTRDASPKQDDIVPIDLAGTRGTKIKALVEAGRPTASKEEAEVGTDAHKAMTPLTTKQAIDAQVGAAYVQKTVSVNVGDGLTGGGNLSGDVTVSLIQDNVDRLNKVDSVEEGATKNDTDERLRDRSTHTGEQDINTITGLQIALDNKATIEQGAKADTALQAPGGSLGQILAKNSNDDNDVAWVSSEAATAVSYGPQELTEAQQAQARYNISAASKDQGVKADNAVRFDIAQGLTEAQRDQALRNITAILADSVKAAGFANHNITQPYMRHRDTDEVVILQRYADISAFVRSLFSSNSGNDMWSRMGGYGDTRAIILPEGTRIYRGSVTLPAVGYATIPFLTAFPNECFGVNVSISEDNGAEYTYTVSARVVNRSSFYSVGNVVQSNGSVSVAAVTFQYTAWGR